MFSCLITLYCIMLFLSCKILSLKKWLYQKGYVKTACVYCNDIHLKVKFICADVWCALYGLVQSCVANFFFQCLENWLEVPNFCWSSECLDTHAKHSNVSADLGLLICIFTYVRASLGKSVDVSSSSWYTLIPIPAVQTPW